jgi:hypothetical protein
MIEKNFINGFLTPSASQLDSRYVIPLPVIPGLRKNGDFIIQSELDETFSTNILSKYTCDENDLRLVEVYKNSENTITGSFIRLAGTMSMVKNGWPFMFLDAAVTNVDMKTGQRDRLKTIIAVHAPQGTPAQRELLFLELSLSADLQGYAHRDLSIDAMPAFWGHLWLAEGEEFSPGMIRVVRDAAAAAYQRMLQDTGQHVPFDYVPVQQHIIFHNSRAEHLLFKKAGLSVPVEAQAAFFSALAVW